MNRRSFLFLLLCLGGCSRSSNPKTAAASNIDYWTCTMHPSVHSADPGQCPICSMDLVPILKKDRAAPATTAAGFLVPVDRQQQIGVTYATVAERDLSSTLRAFGSVESDRRRTWSFVAHTDGYVEKLFIASPGERVEKGTPLFSLYSPELLTTQQELSLLAKQKSPGLLAAAEGRLRQWNVSEAQITALENGAPPDATITFESPFRGLVTKIAAAQGASVKTGDSLLEVADLSTVWIWAEVFETELAYLQPGRKVAITTPAFPNRKFEGTIRLLDPSLDPVKRTARARIDVANPDFALQPGMYVDAALSIDTGRQLAIPVEAVLPTGRRYLAFVDEGGGRLQPRSITLGGKYGDYYAVESGLKAGDRVVASANFLIDAEAKVQGALDDFDRDDDSTRGLAPSSNAPSAPASTP